MKKKISLLAVPLLLFSLFVACKSEQPSKPLKTSGIENRPYAIIDIADRVDMGIFDADTARKERTITFTNTGNGTLYVNHVLPECDCTVVLDYDSIVEPQQKGRIVVSLDMTGYVADTIYKTVNILSNDRDRRLVAVNLVADNRR